MSDKDFEVAQSFDFSGMKCPLPVLKARRALKELATGSVISIIADDPAAPLDFTHFCETAGHELLSTSTTDTATRFIIKKG